MNCIINVSINYWYPKGGERLRNSLVSKFDGEVKIWNQLNIPGCPSHKETPYAFKAHALNWARSRGYTSALWCDSAVWAQNNVQPVFDKIEKDGYFVLRNGWSTGNWSSDTQLNAFGYTREDAYQIPHALACVFGINFRHRTGATVFEEYFSNQHLFKGSWKNENNHLGEDPRIMGTRHDQTVLSLIIHKHGLEFTNPQGWIHYVDKDTTLDSNAIFLSQGMQWTYEDWWNSVKKYNRRR